jgi:hypothetical protein
MWHVHTESTSPTPRELVAGVDLLEFGGGALCVLERYEGRMYAVRYLHDFTRLVTHRRIADIVADRLKGADATVTVNGTRVGAATVGRFGGCGQVGTWNEGPEATKDLIANVRELMNDRRLRFARGLRAVTTFLDELRALSTARIGWATPLTMALALACWNAEQYQPIRYWGGGSGRYGPGSWGRLSGPGKPSWMP